MPGHGDTWSQIILLWELHLFISVVAVSPYSFYIGLKRFNNSAFLWLDGTLLSSDYLGWKQGEPNNKGRKEDCVIMGWRYEYDASFEWYDVECYEWTSRFICQRKRKGDLKLPDFRCNGKPMYVLVSETNGSKKL